MHQPIKKHNLVITVLAIVAIIGFFLYRVYKAPLPVPIETPAAVTPTDTSWGSTELRKETINDSNQYYTISAVYPVTKDAGIAESMRTFVTGAIAQFKDDTSWATDPSISSSDGSLTLDISYRTQKTSKVETYVYRILQGFTLERL